MNRRLPRAAPAWLLALLLLAACSGPLPPEYAEYAGHWRGEGVLLVIGKNGHADYEHVQDGVRTSIEGPVHGFDGTSFRIGLGPLGTRFEVQEPPHLAEGRWRMTVDGIPLWRVEILPVRADQDSLRP